MAKEKISKERKKLIQQIALAIKKKRMKSILSETRLGDFERMLVSQETLILQEMKELGELRKSEIRISGRNHIADNHTSDPSATETRILNCQKRLRKINEALIRIKDGVYGICLACNKPIDIRRLIEVPIADLCRQCKENEKEKEAHTNGISALHQKPRHPYFASA